MTATRWREHGPSILVAALASTFGVTLLQVTGMLAAVIRADDTTGSSAVVAVLLAMVAITFIVIAMYVSAVVTANTFATVIAGRTRQIALLRLIGSTARQQRVTVAREGLLVGVVGSVLGALAGTAVAWLLATVGVATGSIPAVDYSYLQPVVLLPVVAVVITTWAASWAGSRRVLVVSPLAAAGAATDSSYEEVVSRRGRHVASLLLAIAGFTLLLLGVVIGLISPLGVLVGLVGGVLSFTGVVLGAERVMPPALRLAGMLLGGRAPGRLAAQNAVRYPERAARTTIGLVIGVTLVTMFAVVSQTYVALIMTAVEGRPEAQQGVETALTVTVGVFSVLLGFSALIAAVGLINNLSLSVVQRTREFGLLRALGFTTAQLRALIRAEAAQLTIAALATGFVLGILYGWAGAQSLLGSLAHGLVLPVVPWWLVLVVAIAGLLLTIAASTVPARRATRVPPVVALAVE